MKYYLAPMEGITGYIYRNAHHKVFGGVDKYFTPFIVTNQSKRLSSKDRNGILPEHNQGMTVIPQILTNRAEEFIWTANEIRDLGYQEVNLNLGCPSGTVVSKKRGSGFLAYPEELDAFLEQIFSALPMKISVKTRLGKNSPEEFEELLKIFNQYPMEELIIHARIQKDFYKNMPNYQMFGDSLPLGKNPVCYNGDLFTVHAYEQFTTSFPTVEAVMLGRGIIANPGLADEIRSQIPLDRIRLKEFHDMIYHGYQQTMSGERNVLFKMKELWRYMVCIFSDNHKCAKKIKKAEHLCDYEAAVAELFLDKDIMFETKTMEKPQVIVF